MINKIKYYVTFIFLVILIGLGIFSYNYIKNVKYYKPIGITLQGNEGDIKNIHLFGISPKGRIFVFTTFDNKRFYHSYAFFKEVGIVGKEEDIISIKNISILIDEKTYNYNHITLNKTFKIIKGENLGVKDYIVFLLPETFYTKDAKFKIFLSITHWLVFEKILLIFFVLIIILLSLLYFKNIIHYLKIFYRKIIKKKSFLINKIIHNPIFSKKNSENYIIIL